MKSIVKKAREIVTQLYERNMVSWNDLDREVVFSIQALIAEVQRMEALAQPEQEPVAYINIEERKLEWAYKYMSWDTPTIVNLPKIPLYTTPPQRKD